LVDVERPVTDEFHIPADMRSGRPPEHRHDICQKVRLFSAAK
jgi:hypothetical protein